MLVFLDVDGTLVGPEGVVSDEALEAADALREFGARLIVTTGRPAGSTTRQIVERLDPSAPHIYLNGALIQTGRGRTIHTEPVPPEVVERLVEASREWDETLELYTDAEIYVDELTEATLEHSEYVGIKPQARDLLDVIGSEEVLKAHWILDPASLERVLELEMPDCEAATATSPLMPETAFVSVTRAGTSKGAAAQRVAARLDLELADAAAVGDAQSDQPVLERVGYPFVMAEAPAEMRESFPTVGSIDDDGVLEVFEHVAQALFRRD